MSDIFGDDYYKKLFASIGQPVVPGNVTSTADTLKKFADDNPDKEFNLATAGKTAPFAGAPTGAWIPNDIADTFKRSVAEADDPIELENKLNSSYFLSQLKGISFEDAFKNHDEILAADYGTAMSPKTWYDAVANTWKATTIQNQASKLASQLLDRWHGNYAEIASDPLYQQILELNEQMPPADVMKRSVPTQFLKAFAQLVPSVAESSKAGNLWGMAGMILATGAAAAAGVTLTPAIGVGATVAGIGYVTLPSVAFLSNKVFSTIGASIAGMNMERGQAYLDMINYRDPKTGKRVNPTVAATFATIYGGVSGLIEGMEFNTVWNSLSGLNSAKKRLLNEALASTLKSIPDAAQRAGTMTRILNSTVGMYGKNVASETLQETMQEATQIWATDLARQVTNKLENTNISPISPAEVKQRIVDTIVTTAMGSVVLGGAPTVIDLLVPDVNKTTAEKKPTIKPPTAMPKEATVSGERYDKYAAAAMQPLPAGTVFQAKEFGDGFILRAGDSKKKELSHLTYEADPSEDEADTSPGTVTITGFAPGKNPAIDKALVLDLAKKYTGWNIEWEAQTPDAEALKLYLEKNNPQGTGVQWYSPDATLESVKAVLQENRPDWTPEQVDDAAYIVKPFAVAFGMKPDELIGQSIAPKVLEPGMIGGNQQGVFGAAKQTTIDGLVKTVIDLAPNANPATFTHEITHAFMTFGQNNRAVPQIDAFMKRAESVFGVADGNWQGAFAGWTDNYKYNNKTAEEAFAYALEDYIATGVAPTPESEGFFQRMAKFLYDLYQSVKQRVTLTPEITKFYDDMFTASPIAAEIVTPAKGEASGTVLNQGGTQDEQGWIYKAEEVISQKMQGPMPASNVLKMLQGAGVKADELKWTGLDEFLAGNEKKTPQEVKEFIAGNKLQIQEVEKGTSEYRAFAIEMQKKYGDLWMTKLNDEEREIGNIVSRKHAEQENTKFPQYTLPGGENYREVLFTLPEEPKERTSARENHENFIHEMERKYGAYNPRLFTQEDFQKLQELRGEVKRTTSNDLPTVYRSNHWNEPNVLAHTRLNDRTTTDGDKMLFIEEIQSDWGQEGRKKGFKSEQKSKIVEREVDGKTVFQVVAPNGEVFSEERTRATAEKVLNNQFNNLSGVPNMPFSKTWHEFVFKRILRMAADGGYDSVGWTTGEQQAERYDLSKQIDVLYYKKNGNGTYDLSANQRGTGDEIEIASNIQESAIENYIGKDAAQKVIEDKGHLSEYSDDGQKFLKGFDLKVGGEGMKGFYDKILVDFANKYGKKWGAQVQDADIPAGRGYEGKSPYIQDLNQTVHSLPITEAMRPAVKEGQMLFQGGTDTPAFKEWFADSKVVDEHGKPLVVYHGTETAGFDQFSLEKRGSHTRSPDAYLGFSFTNRPETADAYSKGYEIENAEKYRQRFGEYPKALMAEMAGRNSATYPVYLSIKNPAIPPSSSEYNTPERIAEYIRQGHDGVIRTLYHSSEYDIDEIEYTVFSPTQIKSVNNRGTWDQNDPRILYQGGESADIPGMEAETHAMLKKVADESKDAKEFASKLTQDNLMDLSNPELHRFGRAIPTYPDEKYTDIAEIAADKSKTGYLEDIKYDDRNVYNAINNGKPTITIYRAIPITDKTALISHYEKEKAYILKHGKVPANIETDLSASEYYDEVSTKVDELNASTEVESQEKIRVGDYVALDRAYAKMHGESVLQGQQKVPYKIVSKTVPKEDVIWGEADWSEWAYSPKALREKYPTLGALYDDLVKPVSEYDKILFQGEAIHNEVKAEAQHFAESGQTIEQFIEYMETPLMDDERIAWNIPDLSPEAKQAWYKEAWDAALAPAPETEPTIAEWVKGLAENNYTGVRRLLSAIWENVILVKDARPEVGADPEEIQALLETKDAAAEMRAEIAEPIIAGSLAIGAGRNVSTRFLSTLQGIIKANPEAYARIAGDIMADKKLSAIGKKAEAAKNGDIEGKELGRMTISQRTALGQQISDEKLSKAIISGEVANEEVGAYVKKMKAEARADKRLIAKLEGEIKASEAEVDANTKTIGQGRQERKQVQDELKKIIARIDKLVNAGKEIPAALESQRVSIEKRLASTSAKLIAAQDWIEIENQLQKEQRRENFADLNIQQAKARGESASGEDIRTRQDARDKIAELTTKLSISKDYKNNAQIQTYLAKLEERTALQDKNRKQAASLKAARELSQYKERLRRQVQREPGKAMNIDYQQQIAKLQSDAKEAGINKLSIRELETLATKIMFLREIGNSVQRAKNEDYRMQIEADQAAVSAPILESPKYEEPSGLDTTKPNKKRFLNRVKEAKYSAKNARRFIRDVLDGGVDGPNVQRLHFDKERVLREQLIQQERRKTNLQNAILAAGKNPAEFFSTEITIPKAGPQRGDVKITKDDLMSLELAFRNEDSRQALLYGEFFSATEREEHRGDQEWFDIEGEYRFLKLMDAIDANLTSGDYKILEAYEQDGAETAPRLATVQADVYNLPFKVVDHYYGIIRKGATAKIDEQMQMEHNSRAIRGKAPPRRGFTKERVKIAPWNQTPVKMGLLNTVNESIDRQEHLIAYAKYVKEIESTYKTPKMEEDIRSIGGDAAIAYLYDYIDNLKNPQEMNDRAKNDSMVRFMRGNVAFAALAFRTASMMTQITTSIWPAMQYSGPIRLVAEVAKMMANPIAYLHETEGMSVRLRARAKQGFDVMQEAIKSGKADTKFGKGIKKVESFGMLGLELVDRFSVSVGWRAMYDRYLDEFDGDEQKALEMADDKTMMTQPSAFSDDLAPMFQNKSGWAQIILQFQSSLNVIFQNIAYDMPSAVRSKNIAWVIGIVTSYAIAGILLKAVKTHPEDDETPEEKAKRLFFWSTTQATDSIPLIGEIATNFTQRLITGEKAPTYPDSMFPGVQDFFDGLSAVTEGDMEKAGKEFLNSTVLLGVPVQTIKDFGRLRKGDYEVLLGRPAEK